MRFLILVTIFLSFANCGILSQKKRSRSNPQPNPENSEENKDSKSKDEEANKNNSENVADKIQEISLASLSFSIPKEGDKNLIKIEDAPEGTFLLTDIRTISKPQNVDAVVVVQHKLAKAGEISREKDEIHHIAEEANYLKDWKYLTGVQLQLPLSIEVDNHVLSFKDEHHYWQSKDKTSKNADWHFAEDAIKADQKKYTADIDFEESFRTFGQWKNGYYVNPNHLAFVGIGIRGTEGSIVALEKISNEEMHIFASFELDPTWYSQHDKMNNLVRLIYRKK